MTRLAVSGYASLDHAMAVDRPPTPDRTSVVTARLSDPWPAFGGCAPHVARALARKGCAVDLLTWLGDDQAAHDFLEEMAGVGVGTETVTMTSGRSPHSYLLYDPTGGTTCIYDPGVGAPTALDETQAKAAGRADWLILTVGPPHANDEVLASASDAARFVFAVKADADAFGADFVRRCVARAALVSYSRGEREFLEAALGTTPEEAVPDAVLVETHGARGVVVTVAGESARVPVEPVAVVDTTGAGDTLLAGLVAELVAESAWPPAASTVEAAVRVAAADVADMLGERANREGGRS